MPARLAAPSLVLAAGAALAACSSGATTLSSGGQPGVGPNFVTNTIYAANTTQAAIEIITPSPNPSTTPQYTIGGGNTAMHGPQYLAFNGKKQLFVTDYNPALGATVLEFQTYATGNVLPLTSIPLTSGTRPRGIAAFSDNSGYVFSATQTNGFFPLGEVDIYDTLGFANRIAGTNTGLNVPVGVAVDSSKRIYVANNGASSVTVYPLPSISPTPTSSPTATPSPTPTPSASVSPSPTPTPASDNVAPATTIAGGNTELTAPIGLTLDASGNLYVADAGTVAACGAPGILIFNAPLGSGTQNIAPSHVICNTPAFVDPTDVKVDTGGNVYVIDAGSGPNSSKLYIFKAGSYGTVIPGTTVTLPAGSAMGAALSP